MGPVFAGPCLHPCMKDCGTGLSSRTGYKVMRYFRMRHSRPSPGSPAPSSAIDRPDHQASHRARIRATRWLNPSCAMLRPSLRAKRSNPVLRHKAEDWIASSLALLAMTEERGPVSERGAEAAFGGDGAALVRHHRALDRAEQRDVPAGVVVEAGAGHSTSAAALTRRREGEVLPDQDRVDGAVADPLQRDHTAMQAGLQGVITAEQHRYLRHVEFAALLEILERAAADRQALLRTGFAEAIEQAGDIAHPRGRRQRVAVADGIADAIGELRADEPAVVIGARPLAAAGREVVEHQPVRFAGRAAALQGEVQELRSPFEAAVGAAEYVVGVHLLRVQVDRERAAAAADEGADQPVRPDLAVDANSHAPCG